MKSIKTSKFEDIFNTYPQLVSILHKRNFITTTPIQHKALDYALSSKDLLIQAPTGSGKTLIYAIKSITECIKNKSQHLTHIIIAPNTLLAKQVYEMVLQILPDSENITIKAMLKPTKNEIEVGNILISTPKLLEQYISEHSSQFEHITSLILDEADILLTQEFLTHLEIIIQNLPEKRQDLLFSATYTREMGQLAKEYLHNPKVIELPSIVDKSQISQLIYIIPNNSKLQLLYNTLSHLKFGLMMIFVNRVEHLKQVEMVCKAVGFEVKTISSKTSEFERNKILSDFKAEEFDILIGTDIVSRGVDVPQVSHIINYSIPQDHTKYVHRIGRATRHHNKGISINFITDEDISKFKQVLQEHKITYSIKQTPHPLPELPDKVEKRLGKLIKHKKK